MHQIQRHILKILAVSSEDGVRYKDLKPKEVDGNQFMYHLGVVIDKGYVQKFGICYQLTQGGKMHADRVDLATFLETEQPKITTMIYCLNDKGEMVLFRRKRSPLYDLVHMPFGKLHMGETVKEAANRELYEKTGLKATLKHVGDIYVRVYDGGELIGHILHHMFVGTNTKGKMFKKTDAGIPYWEKVTFPVSKEFVDGFTEMVEIVEKNKKKHFFEEFDLRLPKNNPFT